MRPTIIGGLLEKSKELKVKQKDKFEKFMKDNTIHE
jgi:hypothetical protein